MLRTSSFQLVFLWLMIFSCDSNRVFDTYNSLSGVWSQDDIQIFKYESKDSISNYNLFVNIRNTEDYPFNNLFIITELTYPQGKTLSDTLEYAMAYPDGKLIGSGFTSLKENKLIYKEAFQFDEPGEYTFQISQAMRKYDHINGVKELKGISDVGLRIESKK